MSPHDQAELARALFEESGDALFLLDPDADRLLEVNPAALRLTGFTRAELLRLPATSLFRGTDAELLRRALAGPSPLRARDGFFLRTREDGAWVPVRLTASRLTGTSGPRGLVVARDDRGQRNADEAEREGERRFRVLIEHSADGISLVDEQGGVRYASPAARSILGYDPADLVGRSGFDFVHPDDLPAARARFAEALARPGECIPLTLRAVAAGGSERDIELTGCNRLADPGVRAVVVNYRDVTDRQRAVRELGHQHAVLESLFASIPDVVCYKDRELRFLGGNPAFAALAGRPVGECVGRFCRELFTDAWAARFREIEPGVVETGRPARTREWVTYPDGRRALLDFVLTPLRGGDGAVAGLIVLGRDVTDRERLEEQFCQAQKMDAVGRLAGGIAHDFNNLLTVILGNLELLRGSTSEPAWADELLAVAERAARQAAELTRQMLGFARRRPLRPAVVDLNAVVGDTVAMLRQTVDPRVAIETRAAPDLRPVVADAAQLQQALMNLGVNARDAMPGGGTLTVETANADDLPPGAQADGTPAGGWVRVSVADTGAGMSEEVRGRAFEPFFTTKDVGQGTGLGLAVVYGVVRAHGGWVGCDSRPGEGTRFDIYLPAAGAGAVVGPAAGGLPAPGGHGEAVLVADDERGVRELARMILERQGYRVILAADGAEAVDVFRRRAGEVRLVVLDAAMPAMGGRQAFDAIRAVDPGVPVVFASGYALGQSLPEDAPRTAFLHKPYTPGQLASEVRRLLDESARNGSGRAPG